MNKQIKIRGFEITTTPVNIQLEKANTSLSISPGEISVIENIVGTVAPFKELEQKPAQLNFSPFKVTLDDEGILMLRQNNDSEALRIAWESLDDFLLTLKDVLNIVIDERKLRPGVRSGGWTPPNKGVVIG